MDKVGSFENLPIQIMDDEDDFEYYNSNEDYYSDSKDYGRSQG